MKNFSPLKINFPMPVVLLGTFIHSKANFQTTAWISRVNMDPNMIGVSVNRKHLSGEAIHANGIFSINFPSQNMLEITDFMGLVSGNQVDKGKFFQIDLELTKKSPIIKDVPIACECKVIKSVELQQDTLFVCEITSAWINEEYVNDKGYLDLEKAKLFSLSIDGKFYRTFGSVIGKAFNKKNVEKFGDF